MRAAIATVVIGDSYRRHYERIFLPSVKRYADAHGYDLLLFDRYLCAPEWQHSSTVNFTKNLIPLQPEVQAIDRLLVLDADILVNRNAPPFTELELNGGVGVVDEWSQPSVAGRVAYQQSNGWETTPAEYYARFGFAWQTEVILNGGMFICAPAEHHEFFSQLAARHLPPYLNHPRGPHYEQAAFGYELHRACLARLLPAAWNRIWSPHRPRDGRAAADKLQLFKHFAELYSRSYCLHVTMGRDHDFAYFVRNR
jgi:hypothetical protein